ncbi:MAG: pilus assembly protein [Pseudomonadota bacterium]
MQKLGTLKTSAQDHTIAPKLHGFLRRREGAVLPMMALVIVPLVAFIGLAVDASRGYMVKARLGNALDAAALAGAQSVQSDENFQADIQRYFDANFPSGYMGADVTLLPPEVNSNKEVISLSASASMNTTFMQVLGFEDMDISSSTEVTRRTTGMDIALSIDMSGSMSEDDGDGGIRIDEARKAAKKLVNILFGDDKTKEHLHIGVVPWNGKVNVKWNGTGEGAGNVTEAGNKYLSDKSPVPLNSEPDEDWAGCVFARYTNNGFDDDADDKVGPIYVNGLEDLGWAPINPDEEGARPCLSHGITALVNKKSKIRKAINELTEPEGTTNIAQGLAWAWRVVSPGAPFDDADPFPKGNHQRAIVLLTDGEHYGRVGDGYDGTFGTGSSAGPNGMNDRLRAVADAVKAEGIHIYTIQFYHDSEELAGLMKEVATEPSSPYYYFAPNGKALREAFEEIASHLSELRLSK